MVFNNIGRWIIIWIGIDDTDSQDGGCTTHIACRLIDRAIKNGFDIIGYPRLVRLNPNIPWKTRGNGAISIQIGKGTLKKEKIGYIRGKDVFSSKKDSDVNSKEEVETVKEIIKKILKKYAKLDDENTNSGFIIFKNKPSVEFYKKAVQNIVSLDETIKFLEKKAIYYKGFKNKRGLIGATGAVSWNPLDRTYELISYREKSKWGTKRFVDDKTVKKIDKKFPSTFDNFDYENNHNRLVPNSPCPILYGIRGDNPKDLIEAKSLIKSEKIDSWMIFESNQGTDDHLKKKSIKDIKSYDSVITKGTVYNLPNTIKGGHVIFSIKDKTGIIDCAAYEPTKQFRDIIKKLIINDQAEFYGGVREKPLTINLEKINIKSLSNKIIKIENPICKKCGKHMKSIGKNQGFRCKKCGFKSDKPKMEKIERKIKPGFYEVPVCARRHLSKPLKKMV